ncbi:hypothetical protein O3G_MSEX000425 [Manduca sexta]|nr:hypothetical protein O3G_MSEX000425 [Manduca sexta]
MCVLDIKKLNISCLRIASAAEYQTILCNSRCWMVFLLFMGGRIAYHQANGKLVSSFKVIKELHWFKCDVCHACFTRRCYWKKHLLQQHNVVTPPQRPGRQKVNFIVGQDLLQNTATMLQK